MFSRALMWTSLTDVARHLRQSSTSLFERVFVHRVLVAHRVGERSHLAWWTLFSLLSTHHALVIHSFKLLNLRIHLSFKLSLHLFLAIGNKLVCLCLKLLNQLSSDAFSLLIRIEVLSVILKCLGNLLSLDFLFKLGLVSLVLLNRLFCSHPLYFHLLLRWKHTQLDRATFTAKEVRWNVAE